MIRVQIRVEECNVSSKPKAEQRYYMDMPHILLEVDDRVEEINIENISSIEKEDKAID
jgi:hypothetical protein